MTKKYTYILTIIYVLLIIWIILFKMDFNIVHSNIRVLNFIPFYYNESVGMHFHLKEIIENIIIFIPLGVYLSMINYKSKNIIITGMIFSFVLELFQYILKVGYSDITDIITNILGTMLGILIYYLFIKIFKNKNKINIVLNVLASICTFLLLILLFILKVVN